MYLRFAQFEILPRVIENDKVEQKRKVFTVTIEAR